jgi:methyl-accepting chemotaxis protein
MTTKPSPSSSRGKFTIARKLPLVIVAVALISAGTVGVANYFSAAATIRAEAESKLTALMEVRRAALTDYLDSIRQDLRILAGNETVRRAASDFSSAWQRLGPQAQSELQQLYISENPHPTGQKENLDRAPDDSV